MDLRGAAARRRDRLRRARAGGAALLGGACSLGRVRIVLWAMTRAPVAAVAALRETSVLFAALIGAVLLKEGFGCTRARRRGERRRRRRGAEAVSSTSHATAPFPRTRAVVIVGGGIAGCSTAYHLAKLGVHDVVLLEQGKLTCGTTWHAAGLVGQMRPNRNATRMSHYGIELYATLEAETGLATGWKQCGSVNVARRRSGMQLLRGRWRARAASASSSSSISPGEAGELVPLLRTDDLAGARLDPRRRQGQSRPTSRMSLAKGARNARRDDRRRRRGHRRRTRDGACAASRGVARRRSGDDRVRDASSTAPASGRAQFGALAGVNVPLLFGRALLHRHRADRRRARRRCR